MNMTLGELTSSTCLLQESCNGWRIMLASTMTMYSLSVVQVSRFEMVRDAW